MVQDNTSLSRHGTRLNIYGKSLPIHGKVSLYMVYVSGGMLRVSLENVSMNMMIGSLDNVQVFLDICMFSVVLSSDFQHIVFSKTDWCNNVLLYMNTYDAICMVYVCILTFNVSIDMVKVSRNMQNIFLDMGR
jgi:hypothetical protein